MTPVILAINSGSSSIKFALYKYQNKKTDPEVVASGQFAGIGDNPYLTILDPAGKALVTKQFPSRRDHEQLLGELLAWIESRANEYSLAAAGHRIVHGGDVFTSPILLDDNVLDQLEALVTRMPNCEYRDYLANEGIAEARRLRPGISA